MYASTRKTKWASKDIPWDRKSPEEKVRDSIAEIKFCQSIPTCSQLPQQQLKQKKKVHYEKVRQVVKNVCLGSSLALLH